MAKAKYKFNTTHNEWYTLCWDGSYTTKGEKHRVRVASKKSSADLEKKVNEFKQKVAEGSLLDYSDQSFYDYAISWRKTSKAGAELNTQTMYDNAIKHFKSLSVVRITDIRHSHLVNLINEHIDKPRTCEIIYLAFKQIIKAAIKDHILPRTALDDICSDILLPKKQKTEKRPLNALEKQAYLTAELDDKKRAFVDILYYCGLRRQEALALTRFDFDFTEKTVNINKVIVFDHAGKPILKSYPKTDRGVRKIPLPDKAIPTIKKYVDTQEGYIFHNQDNSMMSKSGYDRMWQSIITSFNIALGYKPQEKGLNRGVKQITNLTAHRFRHNYCTELCYQIPKISTKKIASLLGDTEKMVIEVYSHICDEKENVEEVLKNAF